MSNKISIEIDGNTVELDADVARGYRDEAYEILRKEADAKADFKSAMELQAEGLGGIDKKVWQKYIKAGFKAKTKEARALGDAFTALDEGLEETLNIVKDE